MWSKVDLLHLFVGNLHGGLILPGIQFCLHPQAGLGSRGSNQIDHGFVTDQRLSLPVQADKRKHAVLDFVPFTRIRWIMANGHFQPHLVGELLQIIFPGTIATSVTGAPIGIQQQTSGLPVVPPAKEFPPAAQALYRKFRRVMRHPHVHKGCYSFAEALEIAPDIGQCEGYPGETATAIVQVQN